MSLVYLVTRLPRLRLGEAPPVERAAFIREARAALEGADLATFDAAAMLEEVEETVRVVHQLRVQNDAISAVDLAAGVRSERRLTALDTEVSDLPEWVLDSAPQHVLLRRYWQNLSSREGFLRGYASFNVNLDEVLCGLRCQREGLDKNAFLEQMAGRFDSSSRVMVSNYEQPDLGLSGRFAWLPRVKAALDNEDKLEGERAINQLRYVAIENLKGIAAFHVDMVLATYFQLRLVEREASWSKERGLEQLAQILNVPALEAALESTA